MDLPGGAGRGGGEGPWMDCYAGAPGAGPGQQACPRGHSTGLGGQGQLPRCPFLLHAIPGLQMLWCKFEGHPDPPAPTGGLILCKKQLCLFPMHTRLTRTF